MENITGEEMNGLTQHGTYGWKGTFK